MDHREVVREVGVSYQELPADPNHLLVMSYVEELVTVSLTGHRL